MFDKKYFLGDMHFNTSTMMLNSQFNNDMIELTRSGYIIDFFRKLPKNNFSIPLMNLQSNKNGLALYSLFGGCVANVFGKDIDVDNCKKVAYFALYGILLNLCLLSETEQEDNFDRIITVNSDILSELINENKVLMPAEKLSNLVQHLEISNDLVDAGVIPVLCLEKLDDFSYSVIPDFFEIDSFISVTAVLMPIYLVQLYSKVIIHSLFESKKMRITYVDGGIVKYINTTLMLTIDEDCVEGYHYLTLFDMDSCNFGSDYYVKIDLFSVIDILVLE